MKTKAVSHLSPLFPISLIALLPSLVCGAGIVAFKDQTFHQDAGANVIAYVELKDNGSPSIKVNTGSKEFYIDRLKLAGTVDVFSALPANITNESELEIVRKKAKEYRDFSTKFPKSVPLLANHIAALDACIKGVEGGKARYSGKWMAKDEALAAKQKEEKTRQVEESENTKIIRDKMAFEESQKAKGLAKYDGKWLPSAEVTRLVERSQAALVIEADAANKAEKEAQHQAADKKTADVKSARRINGWRI